MNFDYLHARIDQSALAHNCRLLRERANGTKLCVAVKANAYGHDIKIVLPVMREIGADMLAIASIEEARELRNLGWDKPILLLGSELSVYPADRKREVAQWLVENEIRVTATRREDMKFMAEAAETLNKTAYIHLFFDSGISRMGLAEPELCELVDFIRSLPQLKIEGLYTHFATADEADKTFAYEQLARFTAVCEKLKKAGVNIPIIHAANSAASVDLPEAHFDMIRPGISVYGYHASGDMHNKPDLRPALKLVSYLTLVKKVPAGSFVGYGRTFQTTRETTIGLVPIGYADGYDRNLSNRGKMIVAGTVVPVIGRISMDQTIIDLTDLTAQGLAPQPGDEVVIYDNHRESPNSIENTAELLGTIPYCLTTALSHRVKRIAIRN
jgi:alanine racemase